MSTFIIAEAGANHDRDFKQAIALIDIAKQAGADACKFQTYSSETLYSKNVPDFAGYKNINQLIKDIELPREWQRDLKQYCDEIGIEFMSTPFDEKAVDELVGLGVKRLKIAGFESTDFRFVEMVASAKLPLIISLGIGFRDNYLDKLLNITSKYTDDVTLLHCNNAYPTPMADSNLKTITALVADGRFKVGLSDHTLTSLTPALAVMLGAKVVEKHFTLDKRLPGPDHPFALEPKELEQMVWNIRQAEMTLKYKNVEYSKSEESFTKARRSVIAKCDIKKGELFTLNNISTKRPFLEGCISATDFDSILGTVAVEDYCYDDFIKP